MKSFNDPGHIAQRRCEYNLKNSGMALIAFGVWTLLRSVFFFFFQNVDFTVFLDQNYVDKLVTEMGDKARLLMNGTFLAVIFGVLLLDLLLRWLIGRSAIKDARGKKKSPFYIVVATLFGFFTITPYIRRLIGLAGELDENSALLGKVFTSIFIDITSGIVFFLLVFYAIRLRMIRRQLKSVPVEPSDEDEIFGQSEVL